jgi:phosphopantetheine adenylyltransferase
VSSSKLKELASRGMDVSRYCPAEIVERLNRRAAADALAKGEGAHV